jgi:hypothetical protein
VGSDGDDDGKGPDPDLNPDPNPNKLVCSDAFKITGTLTTAAPTKPTTDPNDPASPYTGCWPVGTWNFTATIDSADDAVLDLDKDGVPDRCGRVAGTQAPSIDTAGYSFTYARVIDTAGEYTDTLTVAGATEVDNGTHLKWKDKYVYKVKVSEGGGGDCEGGLELFSQDGKSYWNFHPALTGTEIAGQGEFRIYQEAQPTTIEKP